MSDVSVKAKSYAQIYSGTVKITLSKGTQPYKTITQHNTGTVDFFHYIWDAVCGHNVDGKLPAYLYYVDDAGNESTYGVIYEGDPVIEDTATASNIIYSFLLPDMLVQGKTITELRLKNFSKVTYATLAVNLNNISANTNIYVEWKLTLQNMALS